MSYSKKSILIDGLIIFITEIIISNLGINNIFIEILCLSLILIIVDTFRLKRRKSKKDDKSEQND